MAGYRLHNRLGYRVSRLARLMQARHEAALPKGLTRLGATVLAGLGDEGVTTPSDLAAYVGITRPAMSRLLKGLEGKGLIARAPAGSDGRQTEVALTDAGLGALAQVRVASDALQAHFAAKLSPDDLTHLTRTLARLAEGEPDPTDF
ncbi:MAG: MarR family transcriptional regulator [Rhodobacteraceae bacterium]|nr:MarR family transcriptional regulator [Paracoccaceae bacterium]